MDALSLRGFFTIAAAGALVTGVAAGTYCVLSGHTAAGEVAVAAVGSVMAGLLIAGCCYLVQFTLDVRSLRLYPEELQPDENLLREMGGTLVHYRTASPANIWDAVGGKLVLTTRRLVFLAHRGQPWHYRLEVPLADIARVEECPVRGLPGGLRVTAADKEELFTFGAIRANEAGRWAEAIRRACDRPGTAPDKLF